jgi:arsenate reductase
MITLWHNPRCSKSRAALALLEDTGVKLTVRRYLVDQPSREEIVAVLKKLGLPASAVIRSGEPVFKEMELEEVDDEQALIDAMAESPILIERPIAIHLDRAVIGRPPEDVLTLLD